MLLQSGIMVKSNLSSAELPAKSQARLKRSIRSRNMGREDSLAVAQKAVEGGDELIYHGSKHLGQVCRRLEL